jgi:ribosomal protein L32
MSSKKCPKCGLINIDNASRCDCGYAFKNGRKQSINKRKSFSDALKELQICPNCGALNPPNTFHCNCGFKYIRECSSLLKELQICPKCGALTPSSELKCECGFKFRKTQKDTETIDRKGTNFVVVNCPSCGIEIRLKKTSIGRAFSCPHCNCRFKVYYLRSGVYQAEVVYELSDMKKYYEILGVNYASTDDELKSAYHRCILGYHPDKVAALGMELRELAERKTKQINEAYRIIKEFRHYNNKNAS